jgi:hypothetical protein
MENIIVVPGVLGVDRDTYHSVLLKLHVANESLMAVELVSKHPDGGPYNLRYRFKDNAFENAVFIHDNTIVGASAFCVVTPQTSNGPSML